MGLKADPNGKGRPAAEHGGGNPMVEVVAMMDGVKDNGKTYPKGGRLRMHKDLVPAHVAAGQVEVAKGDAKQQRPARDKQQRGGANKSA